MKKLTLSLTAVVFTCFFHLIACSGPVRSINVDAEGIALKGYDPVAYFTMGRPVKGLKEHQYEWKNAKWLFASSEHLVLFQEDPARYAPQYGGY